MASEVDIDVCSILLVILIYFPVGLTLNYAMSLTMFTNRNINILIYAMKVLSMTSVVVCRPQFAGNLVSFNLKAIALICYTGSHSTLHLPIILHENFWSSIT